MLGHDPYYHSIIKNSLSAFALVFSDINIERPDGEGGTQTVKVPIQYLGKEKWLVRLRQDPDLNNHVYTVLPALSFEVTGYGYDPQRNISKNSRIVSSKIESSGDKKTVWSPRPWNMDIALYIVSKTMEDGLQIFEQILPFFTPDYSLTLRHRLDEDLVIDQKIPITLLNAGMADEYDGDLLIRRFVYHTLTFSMKLNIYGPVRDEGIILDTTSNVSSNEDIFNSMQGTLIHRSEGDPETREVIRDDWSGDL